MRFVLDGIFLIWPFFKTREMGRDPGHFTPWPRRHGLTARTFTKTICITSVKHCRADVPSPSSLTKGLWVHLL